MDSNYRQTQGEVILMIYLEGCDLATNIMGVVSHTGIIYSTQRAGLLKGHG